jgi:hypothetical protein
MIGSAMPVTMPERATWSSPSAAVSRSRADDPVSLEDTARLAASTRARLSWPVGIEQSTEVERERPGLVVLGDLPLEADKAVPLTRRSLAGSLQGLGSLKQATR